jgi:DNA polymerase V
MSARASSCPLLAEAVPAGFPSPAADYVERQLSLDEHLVEHQEATFYIRVTGDSMTDFGILDQDILVVDRAIQPMSGSIVIAVVDGEFAVKQYWPVMDRVRLRSGAAGYPDFVVQQDQELLIWGVVRWAIHRIAP